MRVENVTTHCGLAVVQVDNFRDIIPVWPAERSSRPHHRKKHRPCSVTLLAAIIFKGNTEARAQESICVVAIAVTTRSIAVKRSAGKSRFGVVQWRLPRRRPPAGVPLLRSRASTSCARTVKRTRRRSSAPGGTQGRRRGLCHQGSHSRRSRNGSPSARESEQQRWCQRQPKAGLLPARSRVEISGRTWPVLLLLTCCSDNRSPQAEKRYSEGAA